MYRRLKNIIYLFVLYITNRIINFIPIYTIRRLWYKCIGMKIKPHTKIDMGQYFLMPSHLTIGNNTHINQDCILDARSFITIGNNVSISHRVMLMTGSHDINSSDFKYKGEPIEIKDYAFIGVNAIVLGGCTIGKGSVVCAGSVVTKDVPNFAVVAGSPAKIIAQRNQDLNYKCNPDIWFM